MGLKVGLAWFTGFLEKGLHTSSMRLDEGLVQYRAFSSLFVGCFQCSSFQEAIRSPLLRGVTAGQSRSTWDESSMQVLRSQST